MTVANVPSPLAARRLGARLRTWREKAGKTQADAATGLMVHESKIYRIESGRALAKPGDIRELSTIYGIPAGEVEGLIRLSRSANEPGLMDGYRDVVSGELSFLADLEAAANEVLIYEAQWMPGLVQSPAYSWAVLGLIDVPDDVRRRRHEFRMARQRVLLGKNPPVRVRVIIEEPALQYAVGNTSVMTQQIDYLLSLAATGVDVRVRPFTAGLHRWMAGGAFTILGFPEAADPSVVYTESHLDSRYMETKREIAEYRKIFGDLYRSAIPVKEFVK